MHQTSNQTSGGFANSVGTRFVFFGRNSGIHGLGHLFQINANPVVRLFWLLVLLASSGFLYLLLEPVVELGAEVNYTPDTRYLPWTTTIPAVTVCETYNARAVLKKFVSRYPELLGPQSYEMKRFLTDSLYGRGACSKTVCVPCGTGVPCDLPWRHIVEQIHLSCTDLLSDCSYNGVQFPCCSKFFPVDSEYGPCYSINTLQNKDSHKELFLSVNRSTGPGEISFRVLADAQVSVHSTEELSTNNLDPKLVFDVKTREENRVVYLYSIVEIQNDPELQLHDTTVRGCRYQNEVPDSPFHTYQVYSYGACKLAEVTEHSFEHCNCVHPVRDPSYKDQYCNFTGINCLVAHAIFGIDSDVDTDDCLPSCVESELTTIHISRSWIAEEQGKGTVVNIQMAALPTLRYQRNLLRNNLDLVVSVGGIVGLFFSASILSIAEILYLLLRRPNN